MRGGDGERGVREGRGEGEGERRGEKAGEKGICHVAELHVECVYVPERLAGPV